ncbi:hypothetical protein BT93_I1607 [Corymbia citriodora subsp. variegata]|nr:hypothetical protein BT93_I1607 [Corymbia citriodora subsp. variegata]
MVKRLLKVPGVDLRAKNKDGLTFLDICESWWQYTKKKDYLYRYLKSIPAGRKPQTWNHPANQTTPLDKPEADLKGHANALLVVATLLATVTFTAAFTLPGGLKTGDTDALAPQGPHSCNFRDRPQQAPAKKPGRPVLIDQPTFKVFILADVLAVSTSLTVLFLLISAMLAEATLRRAIVYSKKLLYLSLGGTIVTFMMGLLSVISIDIKWLTFAVWVSGSSIPFLIKYFQVKSFTSTPGFLHRLISKKSSKQKVPEPQSSSQTERVRDQPDSFTEAAKREARSVQLGQPSARIPSGSSK